MATRGVRRASRTGRLVAPAVAAALTAVLFAGCGAEDKTFGPRPAAAVEVSARVDSGRVQVAPTKVGAGLVNFTVANLSGRPVKFAVTGPTKGSTVEIQPGAPDYLRMKLTEGTYEAATSRAKIRPATIEVGPKRPSSQNQLLLP